MWLRRKSWIENTFKNLLKIYSWFQIKVCSKKSKNQVPSFVFVRPPSSEHTQSNLDYSKMPSPIWTIMLFSVIFLYTLMCLGEQMRCGSSQGFLQFLWMGLIVLREVLTHKGIVMLLILGAVMRHGQECQGRWVLTFSGNAENGRFPLYAFPLFI